MRASRDIMDQEESLHGATVQVMYPIVDVCSVIMGGAYAAGNCPYEKSGYCGLTHTLTLRDVGSWVEAGQRATKSGYPEKVTCPRGVTLSRIMHIIPE